MEMNLQRSKSMRSVSSTSKINNKPNKKTYSHHLNQFKNRTNNLVKKI